LIKAFHVDQALTRFFPTLFLTNDVRVEFLLIIFESIFTVFTHCIDGFNNSFSQDILVGFSVLRKCVGSFQRIVCQEN
jgi:hypothetical protein